MATVTITPGLTMIGLGYVNAALIEGEDGLILIDTGLPKKERSIVEAVAEAGHQPSHVSDILITHCHIDHIGSLAALTAATRAQVCVHVLDADVTRKGTASGPLTGRTFIGKVMTLMIRPKGAAPVPVTQDLNGDETLALAGGITVVSTPGHTPGHVSYLWNDVLIAGDAAGTMPGGLGPPLVAEDHAVAAASFAALSRLEFDKAVFGHGRPIREGAAEAFRSVAAGKL